jgi:hypothetical protein
MLAGLVCPLEVSVLKCSCCFWFAFLNFDAHVGSSLPEHTLHGWSAR